LATIATTICCCDLMLILVALLILRSSPLLADRMKGCSWSVGVLVFFPMSGYLGRPLAVGSVSRGLVSSKNETNPKAAGILVFWFLNRDKRTQPLR